MSKQIKDLDYSTLWFLLGDISEIMGNSHHNTNQEATDFWLSMGSELKSEIDKRLLSDND